MGFETPKPVIYPPLPPLAVEDPWAWYRNTRGEDSEEEEEDDDDDEIEEEHSEWRHCFSFLLFGVWCQRGRRRSLAIYIFLRL
jgi:hypothetical protein